jgi:hypothetical protein
MAIKKEEYFSNIFSKKLRIFSQKPDIYFYKNEKKSIQSLKFSFFKSI